MTPAADRMFTALRAIAGMKISADTDHKQLAALMIAIASVAAREACCGVACWNESQGADCDATRSEAQFDDAGRRIEMPTEMLTAADERAAHHRRTLELAEKLRDMLLSVKS